LLTELLLKEKRILDTNRSCYLLTYLPYTITQTYEKIFITPAQFQATEDAVPQTDLNFIANPSPVMRPLTSYKPDIDRKRARTILSF